MVETGIAVVGAGIKVAKEIVDEAGQIQAGVAGRKRDRLFNLEAMYGKMEGAFSSLNKHLETHGVAAISAMPSDLDEYLKGLHSSFRHTNAWWTRNSGKMLSKADCKRIERVSKRTHRACVACTNASALNTALRCRLALDFGRWLMLFERELTQAYQHQEAGWLRLVAQASR